jgi:polyisoprenoid-binding protein YceI
MRSWSWKRWVLIGVAGVLAVVVGGPLVYFNLIAEDAPAALTIGTTTPNPTVTAAAPATLDGTWTVAEGSVAGYRVKEVLFGQSKEAVGRTSEITGTFTLDGTTVDTAAFTVDMASMTSDQSRRDGQFRGRIMNVSTYSTSTFELTEPIVLASIPAEGVRGTTKATGELTLRGTTKTVTFDLTGRRTGGTIEISGSLEIVFEEWDIPNPSGGPAQTSDEGVLEFLLVFTKA